MISTEGAFPTRCKARFQHNKYRKRLDMMTRGSATFIWLVLHSYDFKAGQWKSLQIKIRHKVVTFEGSH